LRETQANAESSGIEMMNAGAFTTHLLQFGNAEFRQ
jgi:hypothetical protein